MTHTDEDVAGALELAEAINVLCSYISRADKMTNPEIEEAENALMAVVLENQQLRARIAELEAGQKWQDISTAPRDGAKFIGVEEESINVCWFSRGSFVREGDLDNYFFEPAYWQPLPKPPTKENE